MSNTISSTKRSCINLVCLTMICIGSPIILHFSYHYMFRPERISMIVANASPESEQGSPPLEAVSFNTIDTADDVRRYQLTNHSFCDTWFYSMAMLWYVHSIHFKFQHSMR